MEKQLIEQIKNSGFKGLFLAAKIGVTPSYYYQCLGGKRHLSTEKQEALKKLLK